MTPTRLHPYVVALGVLGITTLFLPFTEDVAPSDVIIEAAKAIFSKGLAGLNNGWPLILLAAPFFLALPISTASVQQLWAGRLSHPGWIITCVLALVMAGATLSFLGWALFEGGPLTSLWGGWSLKDYLILLLPLATLALGAGWLIRNGRRILPHALNAVMAMQVAYIANGFLCLAMFFSGWQSGAYMTLVTVLVYTAHIVLVSFTRFAAAAR